MEKLLSHLVALGCLCSFLLFADYVYSQEASSQEPKPVEMQLTEAWVVSGGQGMPRGRSSLPTDPIELAIIQDRLQMPNPKEEPSPSADGLNPWKKLAADEQGGFAGRELFGGVLAVRVEVPMQGIWLLDAQGHGSVRIDGAQRVGDVYSNGSVEIPVELKAGENWLLFSSGRGRIAAKLKKPNKAVYLSLRDTTFPTVLRDQPGQWLGSLLVVNASNQTLDGLEVKATADGCQTGDLDVPSIPPLSLRKIPVNLMTNAHSHDALQGGEVNVTIQIERTPALPATEAELLDRIEVKWPVGNSDQMHRRTFVSQIDQSVQYFGVVPPKQGTLSAERAPAMILTLHGAGVEGQGQAAVYTPKDNTYVIAPTNRRNFGFDWEDWGRWDGLEVFELAQSLFKTDPKRAYLTGHSMGGHGTWHIGTLFPDRFAAIGPSAGWVSFASYAGRGGNLQQDPLSQLLRRPLRASDTLARVSNLKSQGVYILHGDADDNVPVDQARTMREELAKFHPDFVYKEQPGAGHWWGNQCCDWPAMIDFFNSHELPDSRQVFTIRFTTPGPHVSPDCYWFTLESQDKIAELSAIELDRDRQSNQVTAKTTNIASWGIRLAKFFSEDTKLPTELKLMIDDHEIIIENIQSLDQTIWFDKIDNAWQLRSGTRAETKNAARYGVFKEAFRNRFLLVYGTAGQEPENRWMLGKARYDAETFWYRGNGSVDCWSDKRFLGISQKNPASLADRNVILYGNASINQAWDSLLKDSPVQVQRGAWSKQGPEFIQESVSVLLVRPKAKGSGLVAAIGGTDLQSMRASNKLPIFSSGTGYPDVLVLSPEYLKTGVEAVRWAGFFGTDWSVERGEWLP
jgi:pimeloyl-ACP methyl ester carboxylesterase